METGSPAQKRIVYSPFHRQEEKKQNKFKHLYDKAYILYIDIIAIIS